MNKEASDLGVIEKRAYLTWHRDGLADLGLGILVFLFGMGMRYDQTWLAPIYGCMGYPIWLLLKQRITERRLGWVVFSEQRQRREKRGWILLLILGCAFFLMALAMYALFRGGGWSGMPGYLMISFIFVFLTSSLGAVAQLARMHIYSGIILFAGVCGELFVWDPDTRIIIPGAIIVVSGFILLITFLNKYPIKGGNGEMSDERSAGQQQ